MFSVKKLGSGLAAVVLSLGTMSLLTACSPEQMIQDAAEKIVEEQTGVDVDVETGGSLPSDWPSEVPIVDGEIRFGGTLGSGKEATWTVEVVTSGLQQGYDDAKAKLLSAGFEVMGDFSGGGTYSGIFDNGNYNVTIATSEDGSDTLITYVVIASMG